MSPSSSRQKHPSGKESNTSRDTRALVPASKSLRPIPEHGAVKLWVSIRRLWDAVLPSMIVNKGPGSLSSTPHGIKSSCSLPDMPAPSPKPQDSPERFPRVRPSASVDTFQKPVAETSKPPASLLTGTSDCAVDQVPTNNLAQGTDVKVKDLPQSSITSSLISSTPKPDLEDARHESSNPPVRQEGKPPSSKRVGRKPSTVTFESAVVRTIDHRTSQDGHSRPNVGSPTSPLPKLNPHQSVTSSNNYKVEVDVERPPPKLLARRKLSFSSKGHPPVVRLEEQHGGSFGDPPSPLTNSVPRSITAPHFNNQREPPNRLPGSDGVPEPSSRGPSFPTLRRKLSAVTAISVRRTEQKDETLSRALVTGRPSPVDHPSSSRGSKRSTAPFGPKMRAATITSASSMRELVKKSQATEDTAKPSAKKSLLSAPKRMISSGTIPRPSRRTSVPVEPHLKGSPNTERDRDKSPARLCRKMSVPTQPSLKSSSTLPRDRDRNPARVLPKLASRRPDPGSTSSRKGEEAPEDSSKSTGALLRSKSLSLQLRLAVSSGTELKKRKSELTRIDTDSDLDKDFIATQGEGRLKVDKEHVSSLSSSAAHPTALPNLASAQNSRIPRLRDRKGITTSKSSSFLRVHNAKGPMRGETQSASPAVTSMTGNTSLRSEHNRRRLHRTSRTGDNQEGSGIPGVGPPRPSKRLHAGSGRSGKEDAESTSSSHGYVPTKDYSSARPTTATSMSIAPFSLPKAVNCDLFFEKESVLDGARVNELVASIWKSGDDLNDMFDTEICEADLSPQVRPSEEDISALQVIRPASDIHRELAQNGGRYTVSAPASPCKKKGMFDSPLSSPPLSPLPLSSSKSGTSSTSGTCISHAIGPAPWQPANTESVLHPMNALTDESDMLDVTYNKGRSLRALGTRCDNVALKILRRRLTAELSVERRILQLQALVRNLRDSRRVELPQGPTPPPAGV